ncbi:D-alanyl-D-alanine carboxypeptidase [Streptomyces griseoluteus]|uniref:D-alanyl-D-alanine carboxypeptidase n=1 Tax=Streptomyces griseoluteus TaxID=29306 RepID=UPI003805A435
MAGESPDRSKQHEDSVGSAGSVEDEELREAVSAWVRPPSGGSAKGKSAVSGAGSAGTGKLSGRPGKGAAEEGSGTSDSAGSVAAATPDDTFKDSREAGSAEGADKDGTEGSSSDDAVSGAVDDSGKGAGTPGAVDSGTDASAPAAKGGSDSAAEGAGKASAAGSPVPATEDAENAPAATTDDSPKGGSGAAAEDAGTAPAAGSAVPAAEDAPVATTDDSSKGGSGAAAVLDTADTPAKDDEDTSGSAEDAPAAETGSVTKEDSGSAAKDAGKAVAAGAAVTAAKGAAESADEDDAEDAGKAASGSADGSGAGTPAPGSATGAGESDKTRPKGTLATARDAKGKGDAKAAAETTGTPGTTEDDKGKPKSTPGTATDAKDKSDAKAAAEATGTPGTTEDDKGKPKSTPGTATDAKGKGDAGVEGAPLPAPRGGATAPGKPVDTPTTSLKSPAAKKPQVDQPTTMLKVGGKAKPAPAEQEAERTSKFVALKPDLKGPSARVEETRAVPQVGPERTTQQPLPPKPPLDLLAELTNTPPPPETPVRTLVRRVKIWTPLVILLVVILGVVQAMRALPQPTLALTAKDSYTFQGGKPDIPWPADGQAALDVQGIGSFGSSGSGKPVPIASVAKVMTAYLILRDHPLKSGAEGPKISIDKAAQDQSKAGQESTVDVTQGDKITQREALEGVLIASANNVARLLARWDAGSEKAFVAKMNAAAKGLGMSGTTYTDPSGLTNSTVSTAADQVRLAKAAMQQPVFREVAAMMSYTDYKGTYHSNWNQLVGHNNVVGIKTGTTTSALGNLVFAAKQDVGGETRMVIGAVLRQPPGGRENTILSAALDHSDALIRAAQGALRSETVLKKGTVVGYVDDGLGGRTPVEVTEDVKAAGWAGLKVRLSFTSGTIPHTAKAGTEVGSLTVGDGSSAGAVKVPVALRANLAEPGLGAKLTRIG